MATFLEFLASNELAIVVCLMVVIFLLIMSIIIMDLVSKKKEKEDLEEVESSDELEKTSIEVNNDGLGMIADRNALDSIDVEAVTKNLERTQEIEEIKYVEEDEELEKTKALLELETLKKELAKMEQENNIIAIEEEKVVEPIEVVEPIKEEINSEIIKENPIINEDSIEVREEPIIEQENSPTMEEQVNTFESLQEENAIISVEELTKASQSITDEEIAQYEDDGNEPISLKELEALYKSVDEVKEENKDPVKEEKITLPNFDIKVKPATEVYDDKDFKSTPFISPVYGLRPTESSILLEQTANLDKLNEEIRKTNEFLSALKELRKNLD